MVFDNDATLRAMQSFEILVFGTTTPPQTRLARMQRPRRTQMS